MELALDLCDEIVILNKGILEEIDKNNLDNEHLKNKRIFTYIFAILCIYNVLNK